MLFCGLLSPSKDTKKLDKKESDLKGKKTKQKGLLFECVVTDIQKFPLSMQCLLQHNGYRV